MKNKKTAPAAALTVLAAFFLLCAPGCGRSVPAETPAPSTPAPTVAPTPAPSPRPVTPPPETPEPEPEKPIIESWPVRMYIPALGVDAEITDTGTDYEADTMEIAPSASVISWWRESAVPGNEGNAIFGGHNIWDGVYGQLILLDTLEIGDEMRIVYEDGTSLNFCLESVFVYALATTAADLIMDVRGEGKVTVITCKGPFNTTIGTSDNRIVATFKEENAFEIPDPPVTPVPTRQPRS